MKRLKKLSMGWALVAGMVMGVGAAMASTAANEGVPPAEAKGCWECVKDIDCDAVCGPFMGVCVWNGCTKCYCAG